MPPFDAPPPIATAEAARDFAAAAAGLTPEVVARYNTSGPRYTSYPTAPLWTSDFTAADMGRALDQSRSAAPRRALSLYVHLPFCEARCLFCSCNVVITQQRAQAEIYLKHLFQDIEQTARRLERATDAEAPPVVQYHWGGGTPTYLSCVQIERLFRHHTRHFPLSPDAEVAIEVDPRVTTREQLALLRELGFNRISMGVQDVTPEVQEAIRRHQPEAQTAELIAESRALGFGGVNIDLIYGLPHQRVETFEDTLDAVQRLNPDRIALYNYAHVPWISPHQQRIAPESLPAADEKLRLLQRAITRLTELGYIYIGMDHFAKPTDELTRAQAEGRLHRNFMGYTAYGGETLEMDLLGFGISAISMFDDAYAQNVKKLSEYYRAMEAAELPTHRGLWLTEDDRRRRAVINGLLCHGELSLSRLEARYAVDFRQYFADSLAPMPDFEADGLVTWADNGDTLRLTPLGRLLSRNVAMAFDAHLPKTSGERLFSKTV